VGGPICGVSCFYCYFFGNARWGESVSQWGHISVMRDTCVDALSPVDGGVYVDCTLGMGGHTEAILERADCKVLGFDRDPQAHSVAAERLNRFGERFVPVHRPFDELSEGLAEHGIDRVDGILADLGVSSVQLDQADRGFSFQRPGPVDMRMDPTRGESAAELIDRLEPNELADVIYKYGEERKSRRIARAIKANAPFSDTVALANVVAKAAGPSKRIHPATRTFQAIRIKVNDELGQVERLLPAAVDALRPGARLAILTFHSLEDRIVKHFFREMAGRNAPRDAYGNPMMVPRVSVLPPLTPSSDDPNPRARSARLRTAEKI